ncbi:TVP38/TMEM64 family protein [Mesobacillus campisalis]|nr:VTT domain-containing protein [Mesobacillus campisalis]
MDRPKLTKKFNRKILFMLLILALGSLLYAFTKDVFSLFLSGDLEGIRSSLKGNEGYTYLFMLLIMVIQNAFTVIPLLLVITVNITLFGFVDGFIWSWLTSIFASIVIYLSVKYLFQNWLNEKFNSDLVARLEREGFAYVFQARIFPFVPTSLVNILAGLSSVRFNHFLFATIFGNFLYFFVLALIPAGLLSAEFDEYVLGILVLLFFALFFGFKKVYNRKRRRQGNFYRE